MDYNNSDIIIARATPIGNAAIAIIRVSGESIFKDIAQFFSTKKPKPRYAYVGTLRSPNNGNVLDRCVVTYFKGPKSYTGEDLVEIACHGGDALVEHILEEFVRFGYRVAYPGEFSYRAFKNNKLDLIQAESIAAKITSNASAYNVLLQNMEDGATSNKLKELRKNIIHLLTIIEHELDFNEDEITHLDRNTIKKQLNGLYADITNIINRSEQMRLLNKGYSVMIVGYPNVGKSTLFNQVIGQDRAITTPIKGTTRDILEAYIKVKNIPITLYDTAGYRKTKNKIELLGIKKSLNLLKKMDLVLIVDDKDPQKITQKLLKEKYITSSNKIIQIKNKCDKVLNNQVYDKANNLYQISAQKNLGINKILTKISTLLRVGFEKISAEDVGLCSMRQINLLKGGQVIIKRTIEEVESGGAMDVVALELNCFVDVVDEMLGKITTNEVLNNIFKGFCVGK